MDALERAMLVGLIWAVVTAIAGGAGVFAAWVWASRRTKMKLLLNFSCILALLAVYFGAASFIVSGVYNLPGSPDYRFASTAYVHPGPLQKLAPAVAIAATWLTLWIVVRKRSPTPHSA